MIMYSPLSTVLCSLTSFTERDFDIADDTVAAYMNEEQRLTEVL